MTTELPPGRPSVFMSYNWSQAEYADSLEEQIDQAAALVRDTTSLEPWASLTEFMKTIREKDFALLLVSDEYLKSINCMYEASQLLRDDDWVRRVMFVVFENAKVFDFSGHSEYIDYWKQKRSVLESAIERSPKQSADGLVEELRRVDEIQLSVSRLLSTVKDSKSPRPHQAIAQIQHRLGSYATQHLEVTANGNRASPTTSIEIQIARHSEGVLISRTLVNQALLGETTLVQPSAMPSVTDVSASLAENALRDAGQSLAESLFSQSTRTRLAALMEQRSPEQIFDITMTGDPEVIQAVPLELAWLPGAVLPLCLEPGVAISRSLKAPQREAARLAGPVKVIAMISAPGQTVSLGREREMQAVLDATSPISGGGQVTIIEVASPALMVARLKEDQYHILHLSASESSGAITFETEDRQPLPVARKDFIAYLRAGGRPIPLIVLSNSSDSHAAPLSLAAMLVAHGVDRVIAVQGLATSAYVTELTEVLYSNLVRHLDWSVARCLADARQIVERRRDERGYERGARLLPPEWPMMTLWTANSDPPLVAPNLAAQPLERPQSFPRGGHVRELRVGELIGRELEVSRTVGILRRESPAVERYGAAGGCVLTGLGGIGKTAIAGRVANQLRNLGWSVAVHEGVWRPQALFRAVADSVAVTQPLAAEQLRSDSETERQLSVVAELIGTQKLLILFDDFEGNLKPGGLQFVDTEGGRSLLGETLSVLAEKAITDRGGGLVVTCRHPLPKPYDMFLARVPVPPLTAAELGRLIRRFPKLRELSISDMNVLFAAIGGHPRLVEFVDALLRSGRGSLSQISKKLYELAMQSNVTITGREFDPAEATRIALTLGSQDVLIDALLDSLDSVEKCTLLHAAVCYRTNISPEDLTASIGSPVQRRALDRLTDLTLMDSVREVSVNSSVASMVLVRVEPEQLRELHEHALRMHHGRNQGRPAGQEDAIDIAYHYAGVNEHAKAAGAILQYVDELSGVRSRIAFLHATLGAIPPPQASWLVGAAELAAAYAQAGDLGASRSVLEEMLPWAAERARRGDSDEADWERSLSVIHGRLGDLAVGEGNLEDARTHYQADLNIIRRLAATDSSNVKWQRDLAVTHGRLGDLAVRESDPERARSHYQTNLDIMARLAAIDSDNVEWQRDLAVTYGRLGDLADSENDIDGVRSHYQSTQTIREHLATSDPDNATLQRDLSIGHERLGDLALRQGDMVEARRQYQASLRVMERLSDADPHDTTCQRDLTIGHERLGDLAVGQGDLDEARRQYQASLRVMERLSDADPHNMTWRRDHSVLSEKLVGIGRDGASGAVAMRRMLPRLRHHNASRAFGQSLRETGNSMSAHS